MVRQRNYDSHPQTMLTLFKSLVLVHATTSLRFLTHDTHIERIQQAINQALGECLQLPNAPPQALAAECGILPTYLMHAVELAKTHCHFMLAHPDRPAVQIFKFQNQHGPQPNTFEDRIKEAFSTLEIPHLWNVTPQPLRQEKKKKLTSNVQHITNAHNKLYTQKACEIWRNTLLTLAPLPHIDPISPIQQYLLIAQHDIMRKKLNSPAPFLTSNPHLPLQALLRARVQCTPILTCNQPATIHNTYDTLTCPRCHPDAKLNAQATGVIHTHLPKDNIAHVAYSCPTTSQATMNIQKHMQNTLNDMGITITIQNIPQQEIIALSLGSSPPAAWAMRTKYKKAWVPATLNACAALAMEIERDIKQAQP
jgi:hypothetical protein